MYTVYPSCTDRNNLQAACKLAKAQSQKEPGRAYVVDASGKTVATYAWGDRHSALAAMEVFHVV